MCSDNRGYTVYLELKYYEVASATSNIRPGLLSEHTKLVPTCIYAQSCYLDYTNCRLYELFACTNIICTCDQKWVESAFYINISI